MLIFMISLVVILLLAIALQLATISTRQHAMHKLIASMLIAKELPFSEGSGEETHRSVLDQIAALAAKIDRRSENIEGVLKYLRNYAWEVLDHRYIEDIKNPPKSQEWDRIFRPSDDPHDYGLWHRERDLSEGFHRDIVIPVQERHSQKRSDNDPNSES